jgi:hypothetical protein
MDDKLNQLLRVIQTTDPFEKDNELEEEREGLTGKRVRSLKHLQTEKP